MTDITKMQMHELENLKRQIETEIKQCKTGETKPVYVISDGDTNQCFKVKADAIAALNEEVFNWTNRTYVRDVPVSDYEMQSDSWIEV